MDVVKFDSTDISKVNNGDGIIQPGETVGLGISIWNKWGAASDVNVKIEAVGADGKANPYVEVLDETVSFGDISSSSGADNSFVRGSDGIKGVSKPIRIKVNDNASNYGKMEFGLTVTAKNGFDLEDKEVYTVTDDCSFIVQNIQYLRGKIKKDITLDKSRLWIIDGQVTLMDGVTIMIKPGTQVQLDSKLVLNKNSFICKGTEKLPITIYSKNGSGLIHYKGLDSFDNKTTMAYTQIIDTAISRDIYYSDPKANFSYYDHCRFYIEKPCIDLIGKVTNSSIYSNNNIYWILAEAENCLFNNIMVDSIIADHSHNVYVGKLNSNSKNKYDIWNEYFKRFSFNAILNNYNDTDENRRIVDYVDICDMAKYNYYGTDDPKLIGIPDDAIEEYPDIYNSFLTLDSPEIEDIYPFMTEAYITNENGERIENAYPGQALSVHVKFNRDMTTDIQPDVT